MSLPVPAEFAVAFDNTQLPERYVNARRALEECDAVDECRAWADRSAALAAYAVQADNPELENYARRIRARAVRRMGEILREIRPAPGTRTDLLQPHGSPPTRSAAAEAGGISRDRLRTALQVSAIPDADFEAVVESPKPPGTTLLAKMGAMARPLRQEPLTTLTGAELARMAARNDAADVVQCLDRIRRLFDRVSVPDVVAFVEELDTDSPAIEAKRIRRGDLNQALSLCRQLGDALNEGRRPALRVLGNDTG
jgi:hypothetical protein